MSVELRHLRAFVVVAEEAHVGRAAKRLFISQPALSRQMQQLEREVGAPLLIRTPQGVELTETGTELLDRAHVALEAAEDALAVGRLAAPRGPLMLGLPLAGKRDRWFDLVQAFMRRYPEVEVHPRIALTEELQDQVLAGELDGAIGLTPARRPSLTYTHLHEEPLAVFLHVEHPLATRAELSLQDLEGVQVTVVGPRRDQPSGHDAALRALFVAAGVTPRFVPTAELFPARAGLASDYLGVSGEHDFPPTVTRVPLVPAPTLPFEFIQRAGAARAAVRAFPPFAADHLAASCAERIAAP